MTLGQELVGRVNTVFNSPFAENPGRVIPSVADVPFGQRGRTLSLAMLFIDIRKSTQIVARLHIRTAAKLYAAYLDGVARIVRTNGGELRSFNGDGVLAIFHGEGKEESATKTGLQLNWWMLDVLKPKIQQYLNAEPIIDFDWGIGIDSGDILIIRGGIAGENNNDLVWVGNATNSAVKLSQKASGRFHLIVSNSVYAALPDRLKFKPPQGALAPIMAQVPIWEQMLGIVPVLTGRREYKTFHHQVIS